MGACVDLRGAWVSAEGHLVLRGVDVQAHPGDVIGLVGRAGSGVATLASVISGQVRLDQGSARVCGLDCWTDAVAVQSVLAYTLNDVCVWPQLTAGEIMGFWGRFSGGYSPTRQADLVSAFGLDPDTQVGAMSGEELSMVALVGALSREVQVYLLTTGVGALSAASQAVLGEVISEVGALGACVVLTGTSSAQLANLVDETIELVAGRVVPAAQVDGGAQVARGA